MKRRYRHDEQDLLKSLGYTSLYEIASDFSNPENMFHAYASALVMMATKVDILHLIWIIGEDDVESKTMSQIAEAVEKKLEQLPSPLLFITLATIAKHFRYFLEATIPLEDEEEISAANKVWA